MPQRRASSDIFGLRGLSLLQTLLEGLVVAVRGLQRDRRHAGTFREMSHQLHTHFVGGDVRFLDVAPAVAEKPHRLGGDLDLVVVPLQPGPLFGVALRYLILSGRKPDRLVRALVVRPFERFSEDKTLRRFIEFRPAQVPGQRFPRIDLLDRDAVLAFRNRESPREVTTMRSSAMVMPPY